MLLYHAIKLKFLTYLQKYTELHYNLQENNFIAKYQNAIYRLWNQAPAYLPLGSL
jgi:hypothetical protein